MHRVAGLDESDRALVDRDLLLEATEATAHALAGPRDRTGRWRVPWPRTLGTSPWAAARELEFSTGVPHRWRLLDPRHLDAEFDRLFAAADRGALLYVGSRWMPRHVVTVLGRRGDRLVVFDPATGHVNSFGRDKFVHRRLTISGWSWPWLVVEPARP